MLELSNPGAESAANAISVLAQHKRHKDMIVSAGVMVLEATQCLLVVMVQHGHVWWNDPCTHLLAPDGSCCTLI